MTGDGLSPGALAVFRYIHRHGGAMRMRTVLRRATSDRDRALLCSAIGELCERYWIRISWRKHMPDTPPGEFRPLDDIAHLTATSFGKRKHRGTWGMR